MAILALKEFYRDLIGERQAGDTRETNGLEAMRERYTRREHCDAIYELVKEYEGNGKQDLIDQLYEIETGIIGHCSEHCILSYKGEEGMEHNVLVEFVRSNRWKQNPFDK